MRARHATHWWACKLHSAANALIRLCCKVHLATHTGSCPGCPWMGLGVGWQPRQPSPEPGLQAVALTHRFGGRRAQPTRTGTARKYWFATDEPAREHSSGIRAPAAAQSY